MSDFHILPSVYGTATLSVSPKMSQNLPSRYANLISPTRFQTVSTKLSVSVQHLHRTLSRDFSLFDDLLISNRLTAYLTHCCCRHLNSTLELMSRKHWSAYFSINELSYCKSSDLQLLAYGGLLCILVSIEGVYLRNRCSRQAVVRFKRTVIFLYLEKIPITIFTPS